MINVLPEQQKEIVSREYRLRRAIVVSGLVIFALLVSLVLLFPSYFLTNMQAEEAAVQLDQVKTALNSQLPSGEVVNDLISAVRHAQDLRPFSETISVYKLLKIFESKPESVKINRISFVNKSETGPEITLGGIAQDRESLIAFGRVLEGRVEFESVNIPVSNFVRESNIEFHMTIGVK